MVKCRHIYKLKVEERKSFLHYAIENEVLLYHKAYVVL